MNNDCKKEEPMGECPNGVVEHKEHKMSILKRHDIMIKIADKGAIVKVGCKTFAFSSIEAAMGEINSYINDPHKALEDWKDCLNY